MIKNPSAVAMVACLLTGLAARAVAVEDISARSRTRQLVIQFADSHVRSIQSASRNQPLADVSLPDGRTLKFLRRFGTKGAVVQLPESLDPEEAQRLAQQLAARPGIVSAVADKRYFPALVPNDPKYLPGADPVQDPGQWHLFEDTAGINVQNAWDQSTGSATTVVAVLDTGIIPHRDLNGARLLPGYDFFSDVALDNDGEPGLDSDPTDPGDATVDDECGSGIPGEDSSWHGLSVTGVIAAESDNNLDIAGINFQTQVLPIRVLGKCGGELSDVADAIRWAVGLQVTGAPPNTNPADVINLSLSGTGACTTLEQEAINAAVSRGAVVVVAAGNEGGSALEVSPANCKNVIVAGAIARDGRIASYVNVGVNVDVAAPGGDTPNPPDPVNNPPNGVLTLSNFGTTTAAADALAIIQGTSFTAAQVSAVASLMLAIDPALTPALVEDVIKATARAFPDASCNTTLCGDGVLDASAALTGAADPTSVLGSRANAGDGGGCVMRSHNSPFDPVLLFSIAGLWVLRRSAS
jgi:serine protease